MGCKYELTDESTTINGHVLYRIKAIYGLETKHGTVKSGDLGGYVESEDNLSQEDKCWIYDDAKVYGNAQIFEDAIIRDNAQIYGNAKVYCEAEIRDDAKVFGNAEVYDNALIENDAKVYDDAEICGDAWIYGNSKVYGKAQVKGNSEVYGQVFGEACVGWLGSSL